MVVCYTSAVVLEEDGIVRGTRMGRSGGGG